MENLDVTNLDQLITLAFGVMAGIIVTFISSKAKEGLKWLIETIEGTDTELDDKLFIALVDEGVEQGFITKEKAKEIKDELSS